MNLSFFKYQGAGNDFIVLDGRGSVPSLSAEQIAALCHRRTGIGADGLMILLAHSDFDFEMKYYNADGREGSLCGNGGRCLTRFASDIGINQKEFRFLASDGPHEARLAENGWIHLHMLPVNSIDHRGADAILHTGSPHYIRMVEDVQHFPVVEEGKRIRYNKEFSEQGINVNFVQRVPRGLWVRTYERGVEDETLSCGTGVTAAALACAGESREKQQTAIFTRGGELAVIFTKTGEHSFEDIWLCGPAERVFTGKIELLSNI